MKRRPLSDTTETRRMIWKLLLSKTRGRLAAFVVLALLAAAITAITISSAQSKKRARAQKAKSVSQQLLKAKRPGTSILGANGQDSGNDPTALSPDGKVESVKINAREKRMTRAKSFDGDLRSLPYVKPVEQERPELPEPSRVPVPLQPTKEASAQTTSPTEPSAPVPSAPAPTPIIDFEGLDRVNWGAGIPPDTNGDVGPNHYIQTVNTSIGVYNKGTGVRIAAFTFNTFMSQGNFGNICDSGNFGDPVVLYDTFEDRWVISDFAFVLQGNGANSNPGMFQCIAVSKTGDPVSGGWNFYSLRNDTGLGDYPKFGIWPDGLYMTANTFSYGATPSFIRPQLYVFNKAQMYAGAPSVQTALFDAPSAEFALLPSNARLQTGTPPTGSPNYVGVVWQFLNVFSVYKAHVDWNSISLSTFTGPFNSFDTFWWSQLAAANQTAPTPVNRLDELYARLMMQNQYTNIGGVESLWAGQTAGNTNPTTNVTVTQASVRYYQVNVTGGTVGANTTQSFTYAPADTIWRYMPSVAVDRVGNMAIGYSTSNATTNPAMKYAGRLATDPVNSISQTEQLMFQGAGTQSGNCSGAPCTRWGDYSAMSLDPNGCTFWYTNEYHAANGLNWQTRIGSFQLSPCTPVGGGGSIQGTVTVTPGGAPIGGATVALGSRTTTTDGAGFYSFSAIPAGTYPSETASKPGYNSSTVTSIVVTDGNITTQNFALSAAPTSGCFVDTTQADFQKGVPNGVDLTVSPGDVKISNFAAEATDQVSNPASLFNAGSITGTSWLGQTFRAGITGNLTKVTVGLGLVSGTSGTITVEIRNLSGVNPGPTVLASGTLGPVTNVGNVAFYSTTFGSPAAVVNGTSYSMVLRTSVGNTVFGVRGNSSSLANGQEFTTANSGGTWNPVTADLLFTTFVTPPQVYQPTANFVSGVKDANPASGIVTWGTLSWNATVPANTTLQFQAAASNSVYGPFNFVGPDSTPATFFANGGSLAQFNGNRYLKYKAFFTTSNNTVTPTLNDVSVCFAVCGGNVALGSGGATATASSQYSVQYPASGVINGEHDGHDWGAGGGWNDATPAVFPDTVGVNLGVSQSIGEIDVYTLSDNFFTGSFVTDTTTFTNWGITSFQVQYWNGSAFVDVPGGNVTGNNLVKRKFVFPNVTTDRIQVVVNGSADNYYSRVVEIEAFSCTPVAPPTPTPTPTPVATPTPNPCAIPANNVALTSSGSTASASSEYSAAYAASGVIDGEHNGNNWGSGGAWNDATAAVFPDNVEVNFNVSQTINEIDVYTLKDDYNSGSVVNDATTFTSYGITNFNVQYWTGAAWADVPGGAVTGNNLVKRKFVFPNIATDRIRLVVNASADNYYSRVVEIEAFSCAPAIPPTPTPTPTPCTTNVALASNGATATASSAYSPQYSAAGTNNGEHNGNDWGSGGGWNDATGGAFPDDVEINFGASKTINQIDVYTLKNDTNSGSTVTDATTFTAYGITSFQVQYWNGSAFVDVPGGNVTGNNLVKRKFTFPDITTNRIRVLVNGSADSYFSRVVEIEAFSCTP